MKRLLLILLLTTLCMSQAIGETKYVSMAQLKGETAAGWHETYEAHGRTIEVNVTVDLPNVDKIPQIQATQYTVKFPSEITDGYTKISHNQPGIFDGYMGEVLQKPANDKAVLKQLDVYENGVLPVTQAEDNPNDFNHALAIVTQRLSLLTGYQYPTEYSLNMVRVEGRRYLNGKPINEMGQYSMTFKQLFAGVPLSILSGSPHAMAANYYDDENFHIIANYFYDSYEVLTSDLPLLSFHTLREIVESEIMAGRQRSVESIALRYGIFSNGKGHQVTLLPVWEVRGNRATNPDEEAQKISSQEGTGLYWKSVAMDVLMQDGRCYENDDKGKGGYPMPPKVLTWDEVK